MNSSRRRRLPLVLIAGLCALTAFARTTLPGTIAAPPHDTDAMDSCPTGLCTFMAAASNTAANAAAGTCIVSGEKLGSMGKPVTYVHREPGKPDRTILLCCATCIDDFKENPAKFLAKLDAPKK